MRRILVLILAIIGIGAKAQTPTNVRGDYNYTGNVYFNKLYLPSTATTDPSPRDGGIRYNATIGNIELLKSGVWGLPPSTNLYNTSGRLTGDRKVSGYFSNTSRYSMVFDTLSNFEVHAYGAFGAYDPTYHGMRIIMNSSAGVMGFDWQNAAGRGALNVSPGAASMSAQTGTTDNRLSLGIDGDKLLMTNPTTSGTNLLFRIDRVGGAVTLYGYPNTTGQFLTTDATGKIALATPSGVTADNAGSGTNISTDGLGINHIDLGGIVSKNTSFDIADGHYFNVAYSPIPELTNYEIPSLNMGLNVFSMGSNVYSGASFLRANGINFNGTQGVVSASTYGNPEAPRQNNFVLDSTGIKLDIYRDNIPTPTTTFKVDTVGIGYYKTAIGINTTSTTAALDINGSVGFDQLRLRVPYTPTSTSDANGNVGSLSWDENFFYIKTAAGWKRTALTTF